MVDSAALQKYSLFGGLLEEDVSRLLPLMEQESYREGDLIMTEGKTNDRIRFILEGRVAVSKDGKELSELGEGQAFGEMEVLEVMPAAASVKALKPVRVLSISNKMLHSIYKSDINVFALLVMNLARDLSRRLRRMDSFAVEDTLF